jgi:60 kDa SS-A/Ro ribonucleoprotein
MGGTDCAIPMRWAQANDLPVDMFVTYTDNETWANWEPMNSLAVSLWGSRVTSGIHPCQALIQYRKKTGIPAKSAVVGCSATNFSIADPADAGTMDFVGFSTDTPAVLADFARS